MVYRNPTFDLIGDSDVTQMMVGFCLSSLHGFFLVFYEGVFSLPQSPVLFIRDLNLHGKLLCVGAY